MHWGRSLVVMMGTIAALAVTSAFAMDWPDGTHLTIFSSGGERVVGLGVVDSDGVQLTLARTFRGAAVLVVEAPDGRMDAFDCLISGDGRILLSRDTGVSDLDDELLANGRPLLISYGPSGGVVAQDEGNGTQGAATTQPAAAAAEPPKPAAEPAGDTAAAKAPENGPVQAVNTIPATDVESVEVTSPTTTTVVEEAPVADLIPVETSADEPQPADDEPRGRGGVVRNAGETVGKALGDLVRRVGGVFGGGSE